MPWIQSPSFFEREKKLRGNCVFCCWCLFLCFWESVSHAGLDIFHISWPMAIQNFHPQTLLWSCFFSCSKDQVQAPNASAGYSRLVMTYSGLVFTLYLLPPPPKCWFHLCVSTNTFSILQWLWSYVLPGKVCAGLLRDCPCFSLIAQIAPPLAELVSPSSLIPNILAVFLIYRLLHSVLTICPRV